MKKWMISVMALSMLMLTACGEKPQTPGPQELDGQNMEVPEKETPDEQEAPLAETVGRTPATELKYQLEGQETVEPATLYRGDGYTIYIPDSGWRFEQDLEEDRIPSDSWESTVNDDAELEILKFDGTVEDARTWVVQEENDYALKEDPQGGLTGTDPLDKEVMEVRFVEAPQAVYAIFCRYPEEAAEGFGTMLNVMAGTFELTK